MSGSVHERQDRLPSSPTLETEPQPGSLVVYLHLEERSCIASFSGALTSKTRATIDGVADLIAGEESVVLDLSRLDVVDRGGADAFDLLVRSVQERGAELLIREPRERIDGVLPTRTNGRRRVPSELRTGSD
jgi:anti-anti-sigma regulatory factor